MLGCSLPRASGPIAAGGTDLADPRRPSIRVRSRVGCAPRTGPADDGWRMRRHRGEQHGDVVFVDAGRLPGPQSSSRQSTIASVPQRRTPARRCTGTARLTSWARVPAVKAHRCRRVVVRAGGQGRAGRRLGRSACGGACRPLARPVSRSRALRCASRRCATQCRGVSDSMVRSRMWLVSPRAPGGRDDGGLLLGRGE